MSNIVLGYGQLGKEIVTQTSWDYISRQKNKFDFDDISTYITKIYKYDTIINCIAYTDTYSSNWESNWHTNYLGVIQLVDYCARVHKKLIHISTDYIYAGSISPADETDVPVHIRTWYGYTKLLADGYIQAALPSKRYLLIRTSFKPNPFPYPKAYAVQLGNFDYTNVIAGLIIKLINKNAEGIYNVGTEEKTVYDLAVRTKPDVKMAFELDNHIMPRDVSMSCKKMEEFLNE